MKYAVTKDGKEIYIGKGQGEDSRNDCNMWMYDAGLLMEAETGAFYAPGYDVQPAQEVKHAAIG